MFSSALKSISSTNINSHYSLAATPTCTAGPWKVYDARHRSSGKACSVFVFDRKVLDAHGSSSSSGGGLGKRAGAAAFRRAADEVVARLKREASALARLRHPSVLELVEPVEETRGGGLQFATEAVTASLASLLAEGDVEMATDSPRTRRRRRDEMDVLEIQKGLLQLGKALEFLHEKAGLVHGNLTPDAVLVNAKSDWKLSGLGFSVGATSSTAAVADMFCFGGDLRLPPSVLASLDYAAPDVVIDGQLGPAADMFALGLLCVALYDDPHRSPLAAAVTSNNTNSVAAYRRLFASPSSTPSPANNFLAARPLPRDLVAHVLPRLIARRPAQRMTAREFQTSEYFDNILVSTIRFLDAFPAKTHGEKTQFLRGLRKVLPSFPRSVVERKLLPALLDELKDRELAPAILHNIFAMVDLLPSARRAVSDRVLPGLKVLFLGAAAAGTPAAAGPAGSVPTISGTAAAAAAAAAANAKQPERDPARDAALMVVLEHLSTLAANTTGKDFKDDVIPIVATALESPAPSVVDAALRSIPVMLPVLDFSTVKHELFPVVGAIFTKTSSLAIKVRGLQAFAILCGGRPDGDPDADDGLNGAHSSAPSTALDKYTMQEKIVPLVKAIRTKEPAVMVEALRVLRVVGRAADADFVALEILPILWTMALGPLLNLQQFQAFMKLIRSLSARVEDEQSRKLQDLSTGSGHDGGLDSISRNGTPSLMDDLSALGVTDNKLSAWDGAGETEDDFERLVKGRATASSSTTAATSGILEGTWAGSSTSPPLRSPRGLPASRLSSSSSATATASAAAAAAAVVTPSFSWSTPSSTAASMPAARPPAPSDLGGFPSMTPSSTQFSQALPARPMMANRNSSSGSSWTTPNNNGPASSAFSLPPPPAFSLAPPPGGSSSSFGNGMASMTALSATPAASSMAAPNYNRASLGLAPSASSGAGAVGMMGSNMNMGMNMSMGMGMMSLNSNNDNNNNNGAMMSALPGKTGLDKYESLL
ncbi:protein kinase [Grosmannia clavigera kw1407]|uniref:Protein kinase n=1 Tax=Grosmannia clavigera (strain kw1407 / UAMH 11150) TaxID=655863 RepID=F0XML1_GROCL|nr:protein kinase [Grosmannia clavigera kw1407]EFX01113.1 protein kinase [Grosmannia clavigera kw1407]